MRAAAALALTGRHATQGRQAAAGLRAWAESSGVALRVEDGGSGAEGTRRAYRRLAGTADLLFGPYGSGPLAAAVEALDGRPDVLVNHGGAVQEPGGVRVVSVLGPAERYWAGLADVLRAGGVDLGRVAVLHAPSGFGRATAAGAVSALRDAGSTPVLVARFDAASAAVAAADARARGAASIVGCGRVEDDLALGRALAGSGLAVGLVVCGVGLAAEVLGDAVEGWFGPAQWWPGGPAPPVALPAGADYPAAQALAAGLVSGEALARAGDRDPDALWEAFLGLRTRTFLGPFAVDDRGRQTAHAPLIVRWDRREGGLVRVPAWEPPPVL